MANFGLTGTNCNRIYFASMHFNEVPGYPAKTLFGENAESAAVTGWLVFLGSMCPSVVPQGGQPCKPFARSKRNDAFFFFGASKPRKWKITHRMVNKYHKGTYEVSF